MQMCVAWQDEAPNADVARGDDVPIESPMPARPTKRRLTAPRPDAAAHVNIGATRMPLNVKPNFWTVLRLHA